MWGRGCGWLESVSYQTVFTSRLSKEVVGVAQTYLFSFLFLINYLFKSDKTLFFTYLLNYPNVALVKYNTAQLS